MRIAAFIIINVILTVLLTYSAYSQITISGIVTDKETKEPIPFTNVYFKQTSVGVVTDLNGAYTIKAEANFSEIQFSYLGYKTVTKKIYPNSSIINIELIPESKLLQEVVVRPGKVKEKYRNRNNPAVDLVKEMIKHKRANQPESYAFIEYEKYEKLVLSVSNLPEKFKASRFFKKYPFLGNNLDTTTVEGKALLPIYLEENLSDHFYNNAINKSRILKKATKRVSFDDYIDNQGFSSYLNYLYSDINIYDNNVTILTTQFLSPIADLAPSFYRFYVTDSLVNTSPKLAELTFVPRNDSDFLFQGKLYVTLDSNYAVQKLDMSVNKNINLNWVRELHISQRFQKAVDGKYQLQKSSMTADFGITSKRGGLFGERVVCYKNFEINRVRADSFFDQKTSDSLTTSALKAGSFLDRHDSLSNAEANAYKNMDSLQKTSSFKRTIEIATLLLAGYKGFGKWEIGPANTFYSFNPVEGFRLRLGGRTTPKFNDHIYLETYAAYGFKDERWKYYLGGTYSFTGRSIREFPLRTLTLSYQQETKIPGQELQFIQEDNFLLSFKRGINDKWLYNNIATINYLHELESHVSYRFGIKNWRQTPAGSLHYNRKEGSSNSPIDMLTTTELSMEIRWAPNEQFYQGKIYRIPIINKYPVFTFRIIGGVKGLLDGQYNYQNISLNVFKRFYLSQLGYSDVALEGAYVIGAVPFPLLYIHRANQTYSYQPQSYNLMNFLEFVSDQYASIHIDHAFNGFIFNKLPLIKKLKWREVATLKVLYGGIRKENDPKNNTSLYILPTNDTGITTTYSLNAEPYIEGSIGISNIFKFLRMDLVKRFSYTDNPSVSTWGIRARVRFDF